MTMDSPGLNPVALRRIAKATEKTCAEFRPSDHGNARPHTTGEGIRCLNCLEPQWKHWLRATMAEHK